MTEQLRFISLGWGVQSWTLAAMVALGDLPPVTAAIHADTTWEYSATYEFARTWASWLEERGVRVVTVTGDDTESLIMIPAYVLSRGNAGQLRRSCTKSWKIRPIRRHIRQAMKELGAKKAVLWLGITTDEWHRAKDSGVQYLEHQFPLLDMRMSRQDCVLWLRRHGLPVPPKSGCVFCPYKKSEDWAHTKRHAPQDWRIALEVDNAIRHSKPPDLLFVHRQLIPLEKVRTEADFNLRQMSLFDDEECDSGHCFL